MDKTDIKRIREKKFWVMEGNRRGSDRNHDGFLPLPKISFPEFVLYPFYPLLIDSQEENDKYNELDLYN